MRLSEIDSKLRKEKISIDRLYNQYVFNKSYNLGRQILDKIDGLYPTGYSNVDASLRSYQNAIRQDLISLLRSS